MKVNNNGSFQRNGSVRSSRRSTHSSHSSYSSPLPSPVPPKSPTKHGSAELLSKSYANQQKSPVFGQKSPNVTYALKSPLLKYSDASPSKEYVAYPSSPTAQMHLANSPKVVQDRVFNFPNSTSNDSSAFTNSSIPKSPRSPRPQLFEEASSSPPKLYSAEVNSANFNLQSPPKPKLANSKLQYHRKQYQSSKTDSSSNSAKSSLEYKSTTKHPTGDYEDIEYKVCNSLDSDSQLSSNNTSHTVGAASSSLASSVEFPTCVGYRYNMSERRNARTSDQAHNSSRRKESKTPQPKCNIRTNPGYDERYESSKSINQSVKSTNVKTLQRCRKSTSDLTDMTDDVGTTMTSLSRPSSPRRKGSVKGGLAYLASRRGSRDSIASNMSNVSNEDIGPLNFQNTVRGRQRRTSNFLELPVPDHIRPRVCSLPEKPYNPRLSDDLYRLRAFSITNKGGVVNCGDSIINRRSRSNTSVNSTASRASNVSGERSPFDGSCCGSGYHTVDSTPLGSPEDELDVPKYRVVMLGEAGVGKTALVSQFMTSEYMNTYDASLDDEFGERTVSILLDGEESEMIFIDHPAAEMSVENSLSTYEPHACVVVYSIVARASFRTAEDTLNYLWREGYTQENSVIVVGNKADLARSRVISTNDGKSLAVSRDCKFIETSSGIQHNVDELLVGILKQIRLRESREKRKATKTSKDMNKLHGSKTSLSLNIAREILQKICMNDISKSKSCENLHVLYFEFKKQ